MVMLKQFQYYYGIDDEQIEEIMKQKINRQIQRIEEENDKTTN
jgi:transcription initiation factor IIE alpha subunit